MEINPKITIITAVYNAEDTIEQTIMSVLSQDYPNIEYIIIDGESSDGTINIIKKYQNDKRLTFVSEQDNGLYDALNKGVKMATGDYIEIIGADDALADRNVLSKVVKELKMDTDVFSGMEYGVDEKTCRQHIVCDNHVARNKNDYQGGMIGHAAMFAKKSLLDKYPFDTTYKIASDYKFFLQCYYDDTVNFQFSDTLIVYFSLAGMSSNYKKCKIENDRLYKELGVSFKPKRNIKKVIKGILGYLGIWDIFEVYYRTVFNYVHANYIWGKHNCKNKVCRWCGRG